MTTEENNYRIELVSNLFAPNSSMTLPEIPSTDISPILACITIMRPGVSQQRSDLIWSCVQHAWDSFLSSQKPQLTRWLCACTCGEDTRIVRHKGLWKLLAEKGVHLAATGTRAPQEVTTKNADSSICLYGAAPITDREIGTTQSVVTPNSRSFIAALPHDQSPAVESMVEAGWKRGLSERKELRDIALIISKQEGVIFHMFGEFDDTEVGVDCIMSYSMYERAVARLSRGVVH